MDHASQMWKDLSNCNSLHVQLLLDMLLSQQSLSANDIVDYVEATNPDGLSATERRIRTSSHLIHVLRFKKKKKTFLEQLPFNGVIRFGGFEVALHPEERHFSKRQNARIR